jgi:hypothetical protein
MERTRYLQLNSAESDSLTPDEMREGWHFCPDWDFLLTNYNDKEGETCSCKPWTEEHIAHVHAANHVPGFPELSS